MKLTDEVDVHKRGAIVSEELQNTDQYNGIPKVPIVHPYNMSSLPGDHVILALQGKFPERLLQDSGISPKVTQGINDAMKATGVTKEDPFLVVIQSHIPDDEIKYDVGQLLRPMYYFSSNTAATSNTPYTEIINLKAKVVGLNGDLQITPDANKSENQFAVSVHNSTDNSGIVTYNTLISSGNNMAVPTLTGQIFGFYGFYKAQARTLNGAPEADTRGVSVLHVMMDEHNLDSGFRKIFENLASKNKSTVQDIVNALNPTDLSYTAGIINSMSDDAK